MNETNWLKKHKNRLSIRAIEHEIGCPSTTLSKVANGTMGLPEKWRGPLREVIDGLAEKDD